MSISIAVPRSNKISWNERQTNKNSIQRGCPASGRHPRLKAPPRAHECVGVSVNSIPSQNTDTPCTQILGGFDFGGSLSVCARRASGRVLPSINSSVRFLSTQPCPPKPRSSAVHASKKKTGFRYSIFRFNRLIA